MKPRLLASLLLAALSLPAQAASTTFTYQGELKQSGALPTAKFDFRFSLYDAAGTQVSQAALVKDDVDVVDGRFTVDLDFGTVFAVNSAPLLLQIEVAPGAGGAFAALTPRQAITPAPFAMRADVADGAVSVPWAGVAGKPADFADNVDNGITQITTPQTGGLAGGPITTSGPLSIAPLGVASGMIADNAVTAGKLQDGSVTTDKLLDGAVKLAKIDPESVQARVTGTCNAGEFMQGVGKNGGVTCTAAAAATVADGSITSAKILDGTIAAVDIGNNAVGAAALATDAVTSGKILNGAVGAAKVNPSEVQLRQTNACGAGTFMRGLAQTGIPDCQLFSSESIINIITSGGLTGGPISGNGTISIANDGVTVQKIMDGAVITAKVQDKAITNAKIDDGAITLSKIADGAVTSAKLSGSSVTTAAIADAQVTDLKLAPGAVTSAKILDGTIASADLAANAVTAPAIATDAVTNAKIADGAVSGAKVASASVQLRVFGSCPTGKVLTAILESGNVVCEAAAGTYASSSVDDPATGTAGRSPSISLFGGKVAIGHTFENGASITARITTCSDTSCVPSATINAASPISSGGAIDALAAVAHDSSGIPRVAYFSNGAIWLARCADAACGSIAQNQPIRSPLLTPPTGMAIAMNGNNPVVAFRNPIAANPVIEVAACDDPSCASELFGTFSVTSLAGEIALRLRDTGNPVIAYRDNPGNEVEVASCSNPNCSVAPSVNAVGTGGVAFSGAGFDLGMVLRPNETPLISSLNSNGQLIVMSCVDTTCQTKTANIITAGAAGTYGGGTAIALGVDGLPAIAVGTQAGNITLARCVTAQCVPASGVSTITADSQNVTSIDGVAMAIAPDGAPVIAYGDGQNDRLRVVKCSNRSCS